MKTRVITFKKKDLFIDIDNLSLSLSRVSGSEDVRRADALATDTSTANGTRTFTRLTDKRVAELKRLMRDFLAPQTTAEWDNLLSDADYAIALSVTEEMLDEDVDAAIPLMHDYLVKGALSDWYSEVGVGPAESLSAQAQLSVAGISDLLYNRPIPEMQ